MNKETNLYKQKGYSWNIEFNDSLRLWNTSILFNSNIIETIKTPHKPTLDFIVQICNKHYKH